MTRSQRGRRVRPRPSRGPCPRARRHFCTGLMSGTNTDRRTFTKRGSRKVEIKGKKAVVVGGASGMAKRVGGAAAREGRRRSRSSTCRRRPGAEVAASLGRHVPPGRRHRRGRGRAGARRRRRGARRPAHRGEHRRRRHREAHAEQGRSASARRLPPGDRAEPDRDVQPQPAAGVPHVDATSPRTASAA